MVLLVSIEVASIVAVTRESSGFSAVCDLAGEAREPSADLADHHVLDHEPDVRVDRVDRPGPGKVAGDLKFGGGHDAPGG
jgi:hypothetical protein